MKVLVIGESCNDIFCYGTCDRLCPEVPVPVFNPTETLTNPGMAKNVQKNIQSLGVDADLCTNKNWERIKKTRYIDYRTNYMFMRLDENDNLYEKFEGIDDIDFLKYDAVILSDYNKGFLSEEDIHNIGIKHDCIFLDTKKILGDWCDLSKYIKINKYEFERSKHAVAPQMKEKLIVTLGSSGCCYKNKIYPVPKVEIKDLSGAGDTFIAGLVVKYVETKNIKKSLIYANECATKVVQKRGVSTI